MPSNTPEVIPLSANSIPESSEIRGIRYLTCQGGGMKGLGELGAVERLEELGVLAQLEEVAGSSAGGIMATLIAIGCTSAEVKEEMLKLDFIALQDKRDPGWVESTKLKDLIKGAATGFDSLEEKISAIKRIPLVGKLLYNMAPPILGIRGAKGALNLAHKGVQGIEVAEDVVGLGFGSELGLWQGDALRTLLGALIARKTGKPDITFLELAKLAEAPGSPFKKLNLTGSNITEGVLENYNARNFPNMSILEAARISASFPGGFMPVVSINKEGKRVVRVDGGLLENLPDVFNRPPYLTVDEMNLEGGNPRAFALALVTPESKKPKSINNGVDLVKALMSTKMSDKPMYKKYGRNIALIDTMGVDTLEFDASNEQKDALIASGKSAVDNAFQLTLTAEKDDREELLQQISLRELIRIEVALKAQIRELSKSPEKSNELREVKQQLVLIVKELEGRKAPQSSVLKLQKEEELKLDNKKKLLDVHALTDNELVELCVGKHRQLEMLDKELMVQVDNLKLAKRALIMNRDEILVEFEKNDHVNGFFSRLQTLKKKDIAINDVLLERAMQTDEKDNLLEAKYQKLLEERRLFYISCIDNYRLANKGNNPILADFFEDLMANSTNPEFQVPFTRHHLFQYCSKDIESCIGYIEDAERELKRTKSDTHLFRKHQAAFAERGERSTRFSTLLNLKNELDRNIYRKTNLVSKMNQYLLQKAPKFSKVIIPFMKMVAFVSFVCWLPIALPTVPLAKLVASKSANKEVQSSMERVMNFFAKTNIDQDIKLRGLRDTTALFIKKVSDDYVKADKVETSYLYGLHAFYLKNSGLDCKKIFNKNVGESKEQYQKRLDAEIKKLELLPQKIHRSLPKTPGLQRAEQSLDKFRREIVSGILKSSKKEVQMSSPRALKVMSKVDLERNRQQQFRIMHAEYIASMDLKMQKKEKMTLVEVGEYVKSLKALDRDIPENFQKQHKEVLEAIAQSESLAPTVSKGPTKAELLLAKKEFIHKRKLEHQENTHGKWVEHRPKTLKRT